MSVIVSAGNSPYNVSAGHTDTGDIVVSGGSMYVLSGGTAATTTVSSGGLLTIRAGGTANGTTVSNGGFHLLTEALGSQDPDFIWGLVGQLSQASTRFNDGEGLNFMLSVIKGMHPRDVIVAMIGAQMAAVQMSMMTFVDEFARLAHTPQQEMAERAMNRLSRTFATLVGALKHYQTGGEQKLTVRHVSVSDHGQAIVGTVTQAPRDVVSEKTPNATPALTDARQTAMEIVGERKRKPVPLRRRHADD